MVVFAPNFENFNKNKIIRVKKPTKVRVKNCCKNSKFCKKKRRQLNYSPVSINWQFILSN